VIVRVPDLSGEVRRVEFAEPAAGLNEVLGSARRHAEQRFDEDLHVEAEIYKEGTDVYFEGTISGCVTCTCPRCVDEFRWPLNRDFRFLIVKAPTGQDFDDDLGLDHYEGDELDLGRLAREQALLALDDGALCSEACRGLCPRCGVNLNRESCTCRGQS
jgi:uncharacterized protein